IDSTLVSVSKSWISDILSFLAIMIEAWPKIESWHNIELACRIFHAFLKNVARLMNGTWLKLNLWHTHSVIKTCINEWVFNIDTSKDLHIGRVKHLIFLLMVILRFFC
ncbi:unnamed protein product, partial [Meganyctiphanes norvegica]